MVQTGKSTKIDLKIELILDGISNNLMMIDKMEKEMTVFWILSLIKKNCWQLSVIKLVLDL